MKRIRNKLRETVLLSVNLLFLLAQMTEKVTKHLSSIGILPTVHFSVGKNVTTTSI